MRHDCIGPRAIVVGAPAWIVAAIAGYAVPLDLIIDGNPLGAVALPSSGVALTV